MKVKIFTVGCSNGDGSASIDCFPSEKDRSEYLCEANGFEEDYGEYSRSGMPVTLDDSEIELDIVDGKPVIVGDFSVYVDGV